MTATYYVANQPTLRGDHRLHLGECSHFDEGCGPVPIRPATVAEAVGRKVCATCLAEAAKP